MVGGARWVVGGAGGGWVSCDKMFFLSLFQHMFFFLVQTEQGDVFKVTLETEDDVVGVLEGALLSPFSSTPPHPFPPSLIPLLLCR